jgi:hypothetical protein
MLEVASLMQRPIRLLGCVDFERSIYAAKCLPEVGPVPSGVLRDWSGQRGRSHPRAKPTAVLGLYNPSGSREC